ncbi:hypothetical protein OQJ26_17745 [Legionella sp. PATHC038]|uniref:hypothetical protein n=1 Tax=Legionella sheltonii TaxID=2992041 RepID=UPI00224398CD|nr:hypothetical protein [Legionella sp. PATHC038]MCW8400626.1 hypothetical protein [Legionella sp. PATHC038]
MSKAIVQIKPFTVYYHHIASGFAAATAGSGTTFTLDSMKKFPPSQDLIEASYPLNSISLLKN